MDSLMKDMSPTCYTVCLCEHYSGRKLEPRWNTVTNVLSWTIRWRWAPGERRRPVEQRSEPQPLWQWEDLFSFEMYSWRTQEFSLRTLGRSGVSGPTYNRLDSSSWWHCMNCTEHITKKQSILWFAGDSNGWTPVMPHSETKNECMMDSHSTDQQKDIYSCCRLLNKESSSTVWETTHTSENNNQYKCWGINDCGGLFSGYLSNHFSI